MIKILKHLEKREWGYIGICLVLIVAQVYLDLKLPEYMSEITMLIQTDGSTVGQVLSAGGPMLLCAIGSLVAAILVGYFAANVAATLAAKLRSLVYNKVEEFSMEEMNKFSTASLITRSTNDVTQITMLVAMGLQAIIKAPILAAGAIIKITGKSWQWSMSTLIAVAFLLIVIIVVLGSTIPKTRLVQTLTDKINGVTRENLTGIRVVHAYNAESYQEEKFGVINGELTKNNLFINRMLSLIGPTMTAIMSALPLAVYWIGAYLIDAANMPEKLTLFSDMVVFSSYATQVIMSFMLLTIVLVLVPRAAVSAKRINEVLETEVTIKDGPGVETDTGVTGQVEFKNVSFKYPGAGDAEYVLRDINFTARKGETVAFIGSTGSGKSTLVDLIPRFYDVTEGEVLVDGVNVKEYTQEELHNKLGYVSQKAVLFSGDLSDNVAFGDNGKGPASEADVKRAVWIAQSKDFVEKMDGTYHAAIARGGSNLSGGQKQRLSIARAVCRDPEVFIFDDSFSALDYKTDRKLREVLQKEIAGTTKLIVAQRIGTIMDADQIVVLDNGEIVGLGTHKELLESCEVYQEIAYSQLSKEELDHE